MQRVPFQSLLAQAKQDALRRRVEASLAKVKVDASSGAQPAALKEALEALKVELMDFEKARIARGLSSLCGNERSG